jgi:hypothetical protein
MLLSTWRAGRWSLAITLVAAALAACSDVPTATRPLDERRAPLDVQAADDEAALVDFYLDDNAVLDRGTGTVRVMGGVRCTAPAKFDIRVSLLIEQKRDGTPVVLESTALPQVQCTTSIAPWSVSFDSAKGLHNHGTAIVSVRTEAPATPIEPKSLTQPVKLIREGRS